MQVGYAWVLNLDAELELARGRPGYVAQRKLLQQLATHGKGAEQLLGPGDVLLVPGAHVDPHLRGRAWCPTPLALEQLRAAGVQPEPHPDAATLRTVNHRLFAHQLGHGLPEQSYVTSEPQLSDALGRSRWAWLLKRPLAFAGRGQMRVLGPLSDKQRSWIKLSFARDGLLLEPLVTPLLEVSLHGFIRRDGSHLLGRPCTQLVSERGVFRGVRASQPGELSDHELQALSAEGQRVAHALTRAGYFGPFGIDAYRYAREGAIGFCSLSEINARYTLGFVTGFPVHPSQLSLD
jgi:hypothetical protein